jgi:hypothetical protein
MTQRIKTDLKCYQINLQHSRAATDNVMQSIDAENTDIVFIQEPYIYQSMIKVITR